MTDMNYETEIKKAELERIKAETLRINAEKEKIEQEKSGIVNQRSPKWWNIRASGLIQSVVGGIVAGALVAGFGLDHFLKVADLNEKSQKALITEKEEIESEKRKSEEENRQAITSLRNENTKLKSQIDEALNKITSLSSISVRCNEETLNNEIALLKNELERVRIQTESREAQLSTDLNSLVQEHKASVKSSEGTWFPVIASPYNDTDLLGKLEELKTNSVEYPIHVYKSADRLGMSVYAVTLGGYLSKADASERVTYARSSGIASDAYAWSSTIWGRNIREQFP